MLNMTLKLTRPDSRTMVLRLPYLFRIILAVTAGGLFVGMLGREGFALVPFIVILLLLVGASYIERWTFSLADGAVIYQIGLAFAHRREEYPLEDISGLGVKVFTKGRFFEESDGEAESFGGEGFRFRPFRRRHVRLSLFLENGEELDIETQPTRGGQNVGDRAQEIASFIGKPLQEE